MNNIKKNNKVDKKSQKSVKKDYKFIKNNENNSREDFIIGRIAVIETLKGKRDINKIFLQEKLSGEKISEIITLSKEKGIQVQEVPKSKLDILSNHGVHQGVIASVSPYKYASVDELFEVAKERQEEPFFIILDGIEDPHNLGSIIRTADASGVHGIIIGKRRAVGLTSVVSKTSTGALEHMKVARVTNITQTIEQLKERGVWVFATDMKGSNYTKWQTKGAIAIVIGNEGNGVTRLVKESCDELITIPMRGHVQSLNASVAAGLLMYEVYRNREM